MDILSGVTLESLVVARRVYAAMVRKAELGMVDLSGFPMLCHAAAVLDGGKDAQLPWEAFTFDQTADRTVYETADRTACQTSCRTSAD